MLQFKEKFNQPDQDILQKLEETVLTREVNNIVDQYPELNGGKVQVAMFQSKNISKSSAEVAKITRGMAAEVRGLFVRVETLAGLLLVIPVSSAEAERSCSALRRLKTWLRTTMTQVRLNNVAVCHVHPGKLDNTDVNQKHANSSFLLKTGVGMCLAPSNRSQAADNELFVFRVWI